MEIPGLSSGFQNFFAKDFRNARPLRAGRRRPIIMRKHMICIRRKGAGTLKKRNFFWRGLFYCVGLLVLAMGLTLNTKADLGVSPIISVSYCVATVTQTNFGDMTLVLYALFVFVELFLHMRQGKRQIREADPALLPSRRTAYRLRLVMDVLQFPLSLVFTRFLNAFGAMLPDFAADGLAVRIAILVLAIVLTGIGAATTLLMRVVPNPGDGIVQAIADCAHKRVGLVKNVFDLCNLALSASLGLLLTGGLVGAGVGSLLAMLGVGRVIAVWGRLTGKRLTRLAGLSEEA